MADALEHQHIPYQLGPGAGNAILVPADQIGQARMLLARNGLPTGGTSATKSSTAATGCWRRFHNTLRRPAHWRANSPAPSRPSTACAAPAFTWCCPARAVRPHPAGLRRPPCCWVSAATSGSTARRCRRSSTWSPPRCPVCARRTSQSPTPAARCWRAPGPLATGSAMTEDEMPHHGAASGPCGRGHAAATLGAGHVLRPRRRSRWTSTGCRRRRSATTRTDKWCAARKAPPTTPN